MFWSGKECVVVVFQCVYVGCILSARLEEFKEVSGVVSNLVCEVLPNMFAFGPFYVFGKCFLEIFVGGPVFCCVVCVRAFIESLFFSMLSA